MLKKLVSAVLVLCLLMSAASCALAAYDGSKPACRNPEHAKWDGQKHDRPQSCWITGHFYCDGLDHERAACGMWGHFNCDGKEHVAASCGVEGHFACKGKHAVADCGLDHCIADGKRHAPASCGVEGHFACDGVHSTQVMSQYCNAEPQHKKCEKTATHFCDPAQGGCNETYLCSDSNKHTTCSKCGLLWCDDSLGSHYTPCGNANHRPCLYKLQGKSWHASEHRKCDLCGGGKCSGRHGAGVCVPVCDQCGEIRKNWESHRAECGEHFECRSSSKRLNHSWCSKCDMPKCRKNHAKVHANKK